MTSDWMFWIAGGVLGIAGLWLAYWSLFSDRAKGRKRCPKCWYNMQAAESLRCPECGHTAKTDRKLLKTRRRWRWAFVSGLLLLGSFSLEVVPRYRSSDWREKSSTTLLVLLAYLADDQESFGSAVDRSRAPSRYSTIPYIFQEDALADWQWRLMMAHALRRLENSPIGSPDPKIIDYLSDGPPYAGLAIEGLASLLAESTDEVASSVIGQIHPHAFRSWHHSFSAEERAVWVKTLLDTLVRVDTESRKGIVRALGECGPEAVVAVPHLLVLLDEDDVELRVDVARSLADINNPFGSLWRIASLTSKSKAHIDGLLAQVGTNYEEIIEALTGLLESDESEEVQLTAAISLCQLGEENPRAHQLILDHLMRPSGSHYSILFRMQFFAEQAQFLLPGLEFILTRPQDYPESTYEWAEMVKHNIENDSP